MINRQDTTSDIAELTGKIEQFQSGQMDEERFKLYRLTRGVYGQRQQGVHMFRTKIPMGRITPDQILALADAAEQYGSSNLHLTTRQNVQLHYVKLQDSIKVWEILAGADMTAREACGNTVRNITASAMVGIDPAEPFDVTPYVEAVFNYFLRNPICQDMGRKIKISFSSSARDTAFGYFHDFGFIPVIQDGQRGFKILVGGGLGALSIPAQTAYDFLPTDKIIPFVEAALRVFDRYGERAKRQKARMKFLIKKWGVEHFLELVQKEWDVLKQQTLDIDPEDFTTVGGRNKQLDRIDIPQTTDYSLWYRTNVIAEKQDDLYAVRIRIPRGDLSSDQARAFGRWAKDYADQDIRITVQQGLLLRNFSAEELPAVYRDLVTLDLALPGAHTIADVTACPGTDTCNLGVTNSTGLAAHLEQNIAQRYEQLITEYDIPIKISGCMNSCGQHMAAAIGFHGSSIKKENLVIPAMQIVLGGGIDQNDQAFIGEKIIKIPTRHVPDAVDAILEHFIEHVEQSEDFIQYYKRLGKKYFYTLLKPFAELGEDPERLLLDWGQEEKYIQAIGVGECAGVVMDLVSTILNDSLERYDWAKDELAKGDFTRSIYWSYTAMVIAAKAALLEEDIACNTQIKIIDDFNTHFVETGIFTLEGASSQKYILALRDEKETPAFAATYLQQAEQFIDQIINWRKEKKAKQTGPVISNYYTA